MIFYLVLSFIHSFIDFVFFFFFLCFWIGSQEYIHCLIGVSPPSISFDCVANVFFLVACIIFYRLTCLPARVFLHFFFCELRGDEMPQLFVEDSDSVSLFFVFFFLFLC